MKNVHIITLQPEQAKMFYDICIQLGLNTKIEEDKRVINFESEENVAAAWQLFSEEFFRLLC